MPPEPSQLRLYLKQCIRGKHTPLGELKSLLMSDKPEETDPLRAYALQNAAREAEKPRSSGGGWVLPFLGAVVVTAIILAAAYYLWG